MHEALERRPTEERGMKKALPGGVLKGALVKSVDQSLPTSGELEIMEHKRYSCKNAGLDSIHLVLTIFTTIVFQSVRT